MFKCLGLLQMFKENLCFQSIDPDGSRRLAPRLQVFNSWNHSPGFNSLENLKYKKNSSIKSTLLLTHFVGKSLIRRTAPRSISPGFQFLKSLSLATSTQGSTSTLHLKAHLANWDFLEFHDDYSFDLSKSLSVVGNKHSRFNFHIAFKGSSGKLRFSWISRWSANCSFSQDWRWSANKCSHVLYVFICLFRLLALNNELLHWLHLGGKWLQFCELLHNIDCNEKDFKTFFYVSTSSYVPQRPLLVARTLAELWAVCSCITLTSRAGSWQRWRERPVLHLIM